MHFLNSHAILLFLSAPKALVLIYKGFFFDHIVNVNNMVLECNTNNIKKQCCFIVHVN